MQKRGQIKDLSFSIYSVIIILIIVTSIFLYINNTINKKDFNKRYTAVDLALILSQLYNAPYDTYLEYNLKDTYRININDQESYVTISLSSLDIGKKVYFYNNRRFDFANKETNTQILILEKNGTTINLYGKKE